jgi:hypothetical protein
VPSGGPALSVEPPWLPYREVAHVAPAHRLALGLGEFGAD